MAANSLTIDWLRLAVVPVLFDQLAELLAVPYDPAMWREAVRYERAWFCTLEQGVTVWLDKPITQRDELDERIIVDFSGNGLANWAKHREQDALDILRKMKQLSAVPDMISITRFDLAFDDFSGVLDVAKVYRHVKRGLAVTNWRTWDWHESGDIRTADSEIDTKEPTVGKTLYLGSRKSLGFARVYDKRAQIIAMLRDEPEYLTNRGLEEVPDYWVRFELEFKRERAHAVAVALLDADDPVKVALGILKAQVDFKATSGDKRIRRRKSVRWWAEFTDSIEPYRIRIPKPIQTVELKKEWIENQVVGTVAVIQTAEPDEFDRWWNQITKLARQGMTPEQNIIAERHKARPRIKIKELEGIEHGW